jgi:hypothetical protein
MKHSTLNVNIAKVIKLQKCPFSDLAINDQLERSNFHSHTTRFEVLQGQVNSVQLVWNDGCTYSLRNLTLNRSLVALRNLVLRRRTNGTTIRRSWKVDTEVGLVC